MPTERPSLPKPRPQPTPLTQPFWDGLREEKVRLQRCGACDTWVYYPRARCPRCLSGDLTWHEVSGNGHLFSFTVTHQPTTFQFADEMPQVIAIVELDEGVKLTTTLVGRVADESGELHAPLRVGAKVVPVFDHGDDGLTLLRYRLA
ncbi:MAG: OB-fold domain-containing protein [Acidimicrobiia bacterium]